MNPGDIKVTKTIYTVDQFIEWQQDNSLQLRPYFQRGSVWKPSAKSYLIDTVIRGFPIPVIYLKTVTESSGRKKLVVDGQQRLRTLISYIEPSSLTDYGESDKFSLLRSHNPQFGGLSFSELPEEVRDGILSTELSVHILPSKMDDQKLLELFSRLNSTGEKLNDQELRNAEYHGLFKSLAYRLSYEQLERWQAWGIFTPRQIAQMRDVEFTSELMKVLIDGVSGKSKSALDKVYAEFDEVFVFEDETARRFEKTFDFLDALYLEGGLVGHMATFRTQSWLYAIFAIVAQSYYSVPLRGGVEQAKITEAMAGETAPMSSREIRSRLLKAAKILESGQIPESVSKALRGASTDLGSRKARLDFLLHI